MPIYESATEVSESLPHIADGLFYSFPVRYVGSVEVTKSVMDFTLKEKAAVSREAVARCKDALTATLKSKRRTSKLVKSTLAKKSTRLLQPGVQKPWIRMCLSSEGLACQTLEVGTTLSKHKLFEISCAIAFVGGKHDDNDFDYVTYVTKCKGKRYCHVFDCSDYSEHVINTFGQIFGVTRASKRETTSNPLYEDEDDDDSTEEDTFFGFGDDAQDESTDAPIYESFGGFELYGDSTIDEWSSNTNASKKKSRNGYIQVHPSEPSSYLDIKPSSG